jgi:hypothetical protein
MLHHAYPFLPADTSALITALSSGDDAILDILIAYDMLSMGTEFESMGRAPVTSGPLLSTRLPVPLVVSAVNEKLSVSRKGAGNVWTLAPSVLAMQATT